MFRHFTGSRRILAIILVAGLALVQARIAFAGCMAADSGASLMAAMDDCAGCDAGNADASRHVLSKICGDHCLQDVVPAQDAGQADSTAMVAAAGAATIPPLVLPDIRPAPPGKTRLIHHLQRLLL